MVSKKIIGLLVLGLIILTSCAAEQVNNQAGPDGQTQGDVQQQPLGDDEDVQSAGGDNTTGDSTEDNIQHLNESDVNGDKEDNQETKTFVIDGRNYEFVESGNVNPDIVVNKGDRVIIEFSSVEGLHDWSLDEFGVQTDRVQAGQSTSVEFVADEKGSFEYYCSVSNHRQLGMEGKFIVN